MVRETNCCTLASAEPLESRRMLAGIESGVLVARGTDGTDTLSVRRVLTDDVVVTVNGLGQTFDMDDFTGVRLEGLGGNDTFQMIDALVSPVVRNITVVGGGGSDTIDYSSRTAAITLEYNTEGSVGSTVQQGAQRDLFLGIETLLGGSGNDFLRYGSSGPPEESVDGQPAEEDTEILIDGRGGNDLFVDSLATFQWLSGVTLVGGAGNDTFDADEIGSEQYFGGPGDDLFRFHNEAGPDGRFSGGDGIDTIDLSDTFKLGGFTDMNRTPDIENAVGIHEMVIGNSSNNRLEADQKDSGKVTIIGGDGNDTIIGGSQADLLQGEEGNDSLVGNAGDDTLDGGPGADTLSGGTGVNVFQEGEVLEDASTPTIEIESDVLLRSLVAIGTGGNDIFTVRRHLTDNVIVTVNSLSREFDMDDFFGVRFEGLGGNDTFRMIDPLVSPVVRNTTVIGGAGHDTISYETRTAAVRFNGYIQTDITVPPFVEAVSGAQTDRVRADVEGFVGGTAGDSFRVDNLAEVDEDVYPLSDLVLDGRGGNDSFGTPYQLRAVMHGGSGNDGYFRDDGVLGDTFFGGDGDDRVTFNNFGKPGLLDGGAGTDTADLEFFVLFSGAFVDMRTFAGVENLANVSDPMLIVGNELDNHIDASKSGGVVTIQGLGGNDTLIGGVAADFLEGGKGDDSLVGNDGDDTIDGGPGTDTLVGGGGSNTLLGGEVSSDDPTSPTIAITGGVLVARGTVEADTFSIRRHLGDNVIVTVNALSREFDMDDFTGVRLEGFARADVFRMTDALISPVVRNVTIVGGTGDDTIDYSSRTTPLLIDVDPDLGTVTAGAQVDQFGEVETVIGGSANDTIVYEADHLLPYRLEGRGGHDRFTLQGVPTEHPVQAPTLVGGDGNDSVNGTRDDDEDPRLIGSYFFFGDAGDDFVHVAEDDYPAGSLHGGSGTDTIFFPAPTAHDGSPTHFDLRDFDGFENGIATRGTLVGTNGPNNLEMRENGTVQGRDGNDTLIGGFQADRLEGGAGNDWLTGQGGNDTLDGGPGTDTLDGGGGSNTNLNGEVLVGQQVAIGIVNRVLNVIGTGAGETISLERTGTDNVIARAGGKVAEFDMDDFDGVSVLGLGGNDSITIKQALIAGSLVRKVTIDGGGGNDAITGSSGDDVLRGGSGADSLVGLAGRDVLFGGAGNDRLFGGLGLDFLDAGDQDDFIDASDSAGGDTILGGSGTDTARIDIGDNASGVEAFT